MPFIATFHSKYRDDFERSVHNKSIANLMVKRIVQFSESADEVWIPQASVEETIREYGYKGKIAHLLLAAIAVMMIRKGVLDTVAYFLSQKV